jgi:hypothetical protein
VYTVDVYLRDGIINYRLLSMLFISLRRTQNADVVRINGALHVRRCSISEHGRQRSKAVFPIQGSAEP